MLDLTIDFDRSKYRDLIARATRLGNTRMVNKAISLAAKRAADSGKTILRRSVQDEYTVPPGEIGKTLKTRRNTLGALLRISSSLIPLFKFKGTKPRKPTNLVAVNKRKRVSTQIKKSSSVTSFDNAFVARLKNGHIGVFERRNGSAYPIREMTGPSITGAFKANPAVHQKTIDHIEDVFNRRVMHELGRVIDGTQ